MKRIFLFLALLAAAFASCDPIEETPPVANDVRELTVVLPDGGDLYWKDGDVVSAGINNLSAPLSVSSNSKTARFTFKKALSDGAIVRFPGVPNPSTLVVPSEQVSDGGQYDPAALAFMGTVSLKDGAATKLQLNCVMAMLKFALKGNATIVRAELESNGGEPVSGTFSLSKTGAVTPGNIVRSKVDIAFGTPMKLDPENITELYVPVLPCDYSKGLVLKLYDDAGEYVRVLMFKDGKLLQPQTVTGFNVLYDAGFMLDLTPEDGFGGGIITPLPPTKYGDYGVVGTVRYDDGKPAVGVKVSDGFTVVVTDQNGNYEFGAAGKDVRYIYISHPSDSRITKNSDGCPDFYQDYEPGKFVYDFNLVRQPVENEFAFFALADPQTHYAKRDTQLSADTDRFNMETVPAINAELGKQNLPCYGVCLGDITYSEGNRDSTPSMEIIRGHIAKIRMPMFNVMGNHDYTFFRTDASIGTNETSSTINLVAQRNFENVFGPINFSFDRGDVHFVCMKDIYYKSTTKWSWSNYDGGFTDAEYDWLVQDLANTPKEMKVVLCVHIPISMSKGPKVTAVRSLLNQFTNSMVFSGHTHYQRGVYSSGRLYEQIHAAVCGTWWWSKVEGDGCPNGYTVHYFNGTDIKDSYFIGVNEGMNTRDYQMRIYKGNMRTGGKYAYFQLPHAENKYMINVFNGDEKWTVKVYENGVYAGKASLKPASKYTFSSVKAGQTYTPSTASSQDWWSIGYHIGVCQRGTSSTSYYTANYHMWEWTATDSNVKISVEAQDPYGNVYMCDDIVTDGQNYPNYIKSPLSIF